MSTPCRPKRPGGWVSGDVSQLHGDLAVARGCEPEILTRPFRPTEAWRRRRGDDAGHCLADGDLGEGDRRKRSWRGGGGGSGGGSGGGGAARWRGWIAEHLIGLLAAQGEHADRESDECADESRHRTLRIQAVLLAGLRLSLAIDPQPVRVRRQSIEERTAPRSRTALLAVASPLARANRERCICRTRVPARSDV